MHLFECSILNGPAILKGKGFFMPALNSEAMILCLDDAPLSAWVAEAACANGLGGVPVSSSIETLPEVLSQADALFLSGEPETIRQALILAEEHGKDGLLLYDFTEVKEGHQEWVDEVFSLRLHYISQSVFGFSLEGVVEGRFNGATVLLVPSMATRPEALERALEFWGTLGAKVFQRLPNEHDALHAAGAQVPVLLAGSYLSGLSKLFNQPAEIQAMAIPELQMLSDLALGLDLEGDEGLENNRENIIAVLESVIGELNELKDRFASQRPGKTASWAGRTRKNALGYAQESMDS